MQILTSLAIIALCAALGVGIALLLEDEDTDG